MTPVDQDAIRAFLSDPASHAADGPVDVIETHANTIFLAGPLAYKMKRAVRFPFLDYSTLALREAACRHEIAVNRGPSSAIYRGVLPVTRDADGRLALDGPGEPVEWLVVMTRFDETMTLDRRLRAGPLPAALVEDLAATIAALEAEAPHRAAAPWIADLAAYVEQNDAAFRAAPDLFPPAAVSALTAAARQWHGRLADLLAERGRLGRIRLLHGDLHAGNVALIDGRPVPFDAIEFDDAIATADLLYDAGFLVMDLDEAGHRAEANLLLNRLLVETVRREAAADPSADPAGLVASHAEGLAALPFFLMMRAAIRAKVTHAKAAHLAPVGRAAAEAEARRYFDYARARLDPAEPVLVAVGGLSGTGKSTLARALAPWLGRRPGALHLRSDVIRKLVARVEETAPLPPERYTRAESDRVYEAVRSAARAGLAAGSAVIVDAVAARPEERAALARIAAAAETPFFGLWLEAPAARRLDRVEGRRGDASDAGAAVVRMQADYDPGPIDWIRVDASAGVAATADAARQALAHAGLALSEPV